MRFAATLHRRQHPRRKIVKTLIAILCATAMLTLSAAQADERAAAPATVAAPKLDPTVVPRGKTYVLLDAGNKKIGDFMSGQKTTMGVTDCVQVNCPDTFGKDVVCWKCKERLKSN
jgi:hypothetical protein